MKPAKLTLTLAATLTAATLTLTLTGCSSDPEATSSEATAVATTAPTPRPEVGQIGGTSAQRTVIRLNDLLEERGCDVEARGHADCITWLTSVVSNSYDAFMETGEPEGAATEYEELDTLSREFSSLNCHEIAGTDPQCLEIHNQIVDNAERMVGVTWESASD